MSSGMNLFFKLVSQRFLTFKFLTRIDWLLIAFESLRSKREAGAISIRFFTVLGSVKPLNTFNEDSTANNKKPSVKYFRV